MAATKEKEAKGPAWSPASVTDFLLKGTAFIALLASIGILWREYERQPVVVTITAVAEDLQKNGYSADTVAKKLIGGVHHFEEIARHGTTARGTDPQASATEVDLVIPGTSMSIPAAAAYLHKLAGTPGARYISGEIVKLDDKFVLSLRADGEPLMGPFSPVAANKLEDAITEGSIALVRTVEPYIYASYLYQNSTPSDRKAVSDELQFIIDSRAADRESLARSYNLLGKLAVEKNTGIGAAEAEQDFKNAHIADPELDIPLINQCRLQYRRNDYDGAMKLCDQARYLNAMNGSTFLDIGDIYLKQGKPAFAKQAYERAIDIDGREPESLASLALAEVRLGELENALKDGSEAVIVQRSLSKGYFVLGLVYSKMIAAGDEEQDHTHLACVNLRQAGFYAGGSTGIFDDGDLSAAVEALNRILGNKRTCSENGQIAQGS